jgi:CrcB protein
LLRVILSISLGAAVGANARYSLGLWAAQALGAAFPSFEALVLGRQGSFDLAALYVLGSAALGLVAVMTGTFVARLV